MQSKNVEITMYANNTINNFKDHCSEGTLNFNDDVNQTLIITLERFSPKLSCNFELLSSEKTLIGGWIITADDRSAVHLLSSGMPISDLEIMIILIFVLPTLFVYVIYRSSLKVLYFDLVILRFYKKHEESKFNKQIREYIRKEFGVSINKYDTSILETINSGRKTINQIVNHTNIRSSYVLYRLEFLTKKEIITHERNVNQFITEYLKNLQ